MNNKSVIVLICNSNMFVPYVLSECLRHREQKYVIMSDTDNIDVFFKKIDLENVIFVKYFQPSKFTIIKSRGKLLKSVNHFNITKIIFFHAEYGGIINWFIVKKSSQIPIFYCKIYEKLPYKTAPIYKTILKKLKSFFVNGVIMDMLEDGDQLIPSLPKRFFEKTNATYIKLNIDIPTVKKYVSEKIVIDSNVKILLLVGSVVEGGYVEVDEYVRKEDSLIECIGANNIVAKCHPRFNDIYGKEVMLKTIPSYIPANLLIDCFDIFIGNHSTLLVEAAIKGKKVLSLVDYFEQKTSNKSSMIHNFFDSRLGGRGIIFYPKNIQEIKSLVSI